MKRVVFILTLLVVTGVGRVTGVEDALCGHFPIPPATPKVDEWAVLVEALMMVESGGDSLAVGRTNDLGILQLTPIYVADANRIVGEERWTLDDRRSAVKSREMFETIQGHYNPSRDIAKAIRLHNPRAGAWYAERVYAAMESVKQENNLCHGRY